MMICDNNTCSCHRDVFKDIDVDVRIDNTSGTPTARVEKEDNKLTFIFSGLKGEKGVKGDTGETGQTGLTGSTGGKGNTGITPNIQALAHVNNTIGDPSCTVTKEGTIDNPVFHFTFSGLKGVKGDPGEDGADGIDGSNGIDAEPFDPSDLENRIQENADNIQSILDGLDLTIEDKVDKLFDDAEWVLENIPQGQIGGDSNFGEEDVEAYLQRLGFWYTYTDDSTGDIVTITKFSKIQQDINTISATVGQLQSNEQVGGQIDYITLASNLYALIENNASSAGLNSYWGRLVQANSSEKQFLQWMLSAVDTYSTQGETFSSLLSAAHDYKTNQLAYAGLRNLVEYDENTQSYVASQSLTSLVSNAAGTAVSQAGVLTTANFDGSVATLFASGTNAYSAVETAVDGAMSKVTITADLINLNGETWADLVNGGLDIDGGLISLNAIQGGGAPSVSVSDDVNEGLSTITGTGICVEQQGGSSATLTKNSLSFDDDAEIHSDGDLTLSSSTLSITLAELLNKIQALETALGISQ